MMPYGFQDHGPAAAGQYTPHHDMLQNPQTTPRPIADPPFPPASYGYGMGFNDLPVSTSAGQFGQSEYPPQMTSHPPCPPYPAAQGQVMSNVTLPWPQSSANSSTAPIQGMAEMVSGPLPAPLDTQMTPSSIQMPRITPGMPQSMDTCLSDVLDFNFELPSSVHVADQVHPIGKTSEASVGNLVPREASSDSDSDVSAELEQSLPKQAQQGPQFSPPESPLPDPEDPASSQEDSNSGASSSGSKRTTPVQNIPSSLEDIDNLPATERDPSPTNSHSSEHSEPETEQNQNQLDDSAHRGPSPSGSESSGQTHSSPAPAQDERQGDSSSATSPVEQRDHSAPQTPASSASTPGVSEAARTESGSSCAGSPFPAQSDHSNQSAAKSSPAPDGAQDGSSSQVASPSADNVSSPGPATPVPPYQVEKLAVLAARAAKGPSTSDTKDEEPQSAVLPTAMPVQSAESSTDATNAAPSVDQGKVNSGWMIVDGIRIPYVMHSGKPFVPVQVVEKQLLSCYPSKYPDELKGKPPLASRFLTAKEAERLMEMSLGSKYTNKDLMVEYGEFNQFYSVIKKHFPNIRPKAGSQPPGKDAAADGTVYGGWLQINNTVIPYILRSRQKFVPLQVLKFAAGFKTDSQVVETSPTQEECDHLNSSCKRAGLKFNFTLEDTRLVSLLAVRQLCQQTNSKISMMELPRENPLAYARYNTNLNANLPQGAMVRGPRGAIRMPAPNMRGGIMRAGMRGGYRQAMQGGYRYPMPVRSINSTNRVRLDEDVAVLHHVQRVEFKGKIITCLVRAGDKEKFALVEAVSKLYFPEWELFDFQNALCNALRIPIYELTDEEEQAFISSYGLPIKHLNCKKAVRLRELDRFMPQLRYIFAEKKQMAAARGRGMSPGKRPGGQMVGGSPFKRAVPPGYVQTRPGQFAMGRGSPVYRQPLPAAAANGRMGIRMNRPQQPFPVVNQQPRPRRPKHDNVVITID